MQKVVTSFIGNLSFEYMIELGCWFWFFYKLEKCLLYCMNFVPVLPK